MPLRNLLRDTPARSRLGYIPMNGDVLSDEALILLDLIRQAWRSGGAGLLTNIPELAAALGCSLSSVERASRQLRRLEWIVVRHNAYLDGGRPRSLYEPGPELLADLERCAPMRAESPAPSERGMYD